MKESNVLNKVIQNKVVSYCREEGGFVEVGARCETVWGGDKVFTVGMGWILSVAYAQGDDFNIVHGYWNTDHSFSTSVSCCTEKQSLSQFPVLILPCAPNDQVVCSSTKW